MAALPLAWYNGLYTMASKPIKSLELHYTMIQFSIISLLILSFASAVQNRFHITGSSNCEDPTLQNVGSHALEPAVERE